MKTILRELALIAAFCLFCMLSAQAKDSTAGGTWRYKMVIEVETPEGVKTGSSVREVTIGWPSNPKCIVDKKAHPYAAKLCGEAVSVDLGERGVLFGLLSNDQGLGRDYSWSIVYDAFQMDATQFPSKNPTHEEQFMAIGAYYSSLKTEAKELSGYKLPMFVSFSDMKDPKSVMKVDPNKLESAFGTGVKLRKVSIQMTDEPLTLTLPKVLSWINDQDQVRHLPKRSKDHKGMNLTRQDFTLMTIVPPM